jgi:hypothetical protein
MRMDIELEKCVVVDQKLVGEEELEVSLWRLNVLLEDLFTVRVLWIRWQETDTEDIVKA